MLLTSLIFLNLVYISFVVIFNYAQVVLVGIIQESMNSRIGHIYLYASDLDKSYEFYKKLLEYLGYTQTVKKDWGFAFVNNGTSLWFEKTPEDGSGQGYSRRRTGLNHIAFRVNSKEEVDKFHDEFVKSNKLVTLYETPKAFPEYDEDYYAVFFEDPDGIKLEVAYYP